MPTEANTVLSDEDVEQLKQIRERQKWRANASRQNGRTPESNNTYADIDFLLSLVDSQVAGTKLAGEALAEQIVNASLCAEPAAACEESGPVHIPDLIRSIAALPAPQYNALCEQHRSEFTVFYVGGCLECWKTSERESAATSMRSRCLEKVKGLAAERWHKQYTAEGQVSALLRAEADALYGAAEQLQSVTIQEQERSEIDGT